MNPKNTPEKFWARVNKTADCWLWTGTTTGRYGWTRWGGRGVGAHRIAWEITNGPIPEGDFILHHCDNKLCVRPDHLYLGTHRRNMDDAVERERMARPKGELNPSAKLTEEDISVVRAMYGNGHATFGSLAALFGVRSSTISNIITRKSWKHI